MINPFGYDKSSINLFLKFIYLAVPGLSCSRQDLVLCCCSDTKSCLFVAPWTAACQAYLSFTISQSLLKFMSIELALPSNHLILCHPLLLLPSGSSFLSIQGFFQWVLVLWSGIKPRTPALGAWSFSHWTIREVSAIFLRYCHMSLFYILIMNYQKEKAKKKKKSHLKSHHLTMV